MNDRPRDDAPWYSDLQLSAKGPILCGLALLVLALGGFGMWAALAPLQGAVVASGTFVANGQNKQIQHFEGGIIREVLIKEGDRVDANQVLLRMDDTAAQAKLRRLILRNYRMLAMRARLAAELEGKDDLSMPPALVTEAGDLEVRAIFELQRTELRARSANMATEELMLRKEIAGLEEGIKGYRDQIKATQQRLKLFNEELRDKATLVDKQLLRRSEVLALQRAEASLSGDLGELTARIADASERIARSNQGIAHLQTAALQRRVEEMRQTETELDDIQEQIRAARDVARRVEIRAPVEGVVVKVNFHTTGGVIAPGAVIMELLPIEDELLIKANVNAKDIAYVREGQQALARLSALNQRITPMIEAQVVYLSADAFADAEPMAQGAMNARKDFYVVRVRLDEKDVHRQIAGFRPTPGMPADVYIKTGERTFFEYIMKPIVDSFSRAFRET